MRGGRTGGGAPTRARAAARASGGALGEASVAWGRRRRARAGKLGQYSLNNHKFMNDVRRVHADVQRLAASAQECTHNADFRGAMATYEQILSLAQRVRQDAAFAQNIETAALAGIGNAWGALGDHSRAVEFLGRALTICRRIGEPRNIGPALLSLGNAHVGLNNYDEALKYYNDAVPIIRSLGGKHREATLLVNMSACHRNQGKYAAAREHIERAFVALRQEGNTFEGITGKISALSNLSNIDADVGQYSKALDRCYEALNLARDYGLAQHEADILNNVTSTLLQLDRPEDALKSVTDAYDAALRAGAKGTQKSALGHKGHISLMLHMPDEARHAWDSALALARELGDRRKEAEMLCCLSSLHTDQLARGTRQPGEDLIDLKPALQIAREIDAPTLLAQCLFSLGRAHFYDSMHGVAADSVETVVEWLQESVSVNDSVWARLTTDSERLSYADQPDPQLRGSSSRH